MENFLRRKAEEEEGVELGGLRKVLNHLRGKARDELEEREPGCLCLSVYTAHRLQEFKFPGPGETQARGCGNDRAGYPPQHQQLSSTRNREQPGFPADGPDSAMTLVTCYRW